MARASPHEPVSADLRRRGATLSAVYGEGMAVCPTGTGGVAADDPYTPYVPRYTQTRQQAIRGVYKAGDDDQWIADREGNRLVSPDQLSEEELENYCRRPIE